MINGYTDLHMTYKLLSNIFVIFSVKPNNHLKGLSHRKYVILISIYKYFVTKKLFLAIINSLV